MIPTEDFADVTLVSEDIGDIDDHDDNDENSQRSGNSQRRENSQRIAYSQRSENIQRSENTQRNENTQRSENCQRSEKKVIACDVSPVAMLCFCTFPYHSSQNIPKLGFMNCTISSFEFFLWEILFDNLMIATL